MQNTADPHLPMRGRYYGSAADIDQINNESKGNTPSGLIPFFDYVNNMEVLECDEFITALHRQVKKYNTSDWRRRLMTLEEKMKIERDEAFEKGKSLERKENARKMKAEDIALEVISRITGLSIEEITEL